ncbi:MAG: DeoR/GlpR family DNA-binding transcription regulator [Gemmiger sp.]|nr:DeoR/GlpR family DNA-binding transcription regulator [Gemmiger sp.]
MLYTERVEFILQQLQLGANVKVGELAELMGVSLDTVRRDLKSMEQSGLAKYVRGGACLPETMTSISHFSGREVVHIEGKRQAAVKALRYIRPGSVIALNSGTTNTVLAQEIIKRFSDLTVVTNNLAAAIVLMQNPAIHTIVVGGELDGMERSTFGHTCESEFARYTPDCAFLSINAVDAVMGYTEFRFSEIGVIQVLARQAKQVIALMDSSKLGRRSKKQILDFSQVDILVMDDNVSEETKKKYAANGMKIV